MEVNYTKKELTASKDKSAEYVDNLVDELK